jgi:hypothetical protein
MEDLVLTAPEPQDRRAAFVEDLKRYWDFVNRNNPTVGFQYGAIDGRAVRTFLKNWPDMDQETWRKCLSNRAKSVMNPAEQFCYWIPKLPSYLAGPLDQFGRLKDQGGNKHSDHESLAEKNRSNLQEFVGGGRREESVAGRVPAPSVLGGKQAGLERTRGMLLGAD